MATGAAVAAILSGDPERALYECGTLLCNASREETLGPSAMDVFEDTIIQCLSVIGEALSETADVPPAADLWGEVLKEAVDLIQSDRLLVRQALVLVTKISLLMRRLEHGRIRGNIAKIREKVISEFPDGAVLSNAGAAMFKSILPPANDPGLSEERAFAERILAGLSRLWSGSGTESVGLARASIEYLSRKKIILAVGTIDGWPAPSREDAQKGDVIWLLWGASLLFSDRVASAWRLFTWNYKAKCRNTRIGLLWGSTYLMNAFRARSGRWAPDEDYLIERVNKEAANLWKQLGGSGPRRKGLETLGGMSGRLSSLDSLDVFDEFMPRTADANGRTADANGRTADANGRTAESQAAELSHDENKSDGTAPDSSNSGVRGVGVGETRANTQARARPASPPQPLDADIPLHAKKGIRVEARHGIRRRAGSRNQENHRIERIQ